MAQSKGKYWLANNPNAEITNAEVTELGSISEIDFGVLSDLTASAAELNKMDGVASTASEIDQRVLQLKINDISTAGQVYATIPWACTLSKVDTVLNGAIGTGDATITVKNNAGSSAGTITVTQSGSATGDKDTLTPASNNTFTAGQLLEIETDGSSTNTIALDITCLLTIT